MTTRTRAVPVGPYSALLLTAVSLAGLGMFCWPFFVSAAPSATGYNAGAPFIFVAVLPVLVLVVLAQLTDGGMDSKALAMLGVLSAVNAALRPLGAGLGGIEMVFFLLILAGRVFGPGFGFVLGCTSLFASALLTAGVGPWLPFQMLCSAWIGMGAGVLPHRWGRRVITGAWEIAMLAVYGIVAAYFFGALMNLSFWPFVAGEGGLGYVPGAPVLENLHRFVVFDVISSAVIWDTGRAITNTIGIVLLGPAVLTVLRRAVRRARFHPTVRSAAPPTPGDGPAAPTPPADPVPDTPRTPPLRV